MNTLVCFALKEEAAPFRKAAYPLHDLELAIRIVGIGRQNAEKSVRAFLAGGASPIASGAATASRLQDNSQARLKGTLAPPDLVLTCGFAGALNPGLKLGEVVFEIPSRGSRREPAQINSKNKSELTDVGCYEKLMAAGARPGKFFCADRIATTVAEKKKLREQTGADAVEMESAAIHAVCAEHGIPCVTVRVISDTANEDLPLDFNALAKPDKNLDYGKLFLAIAKSPGKIGALIALQKKTQSAAKQLAAVLEKVTFP
jgi:hypothetical protein